MTKETREAKTIFHMRTTESTIVLSKATMAGRGCMCQAWWGMILKAVLQVTKQPAYPVDTLSLLLSLQENHKG